MRLYLCSLVVLLLTLSASAQDGPPPPNGVIPLFGIASAVEKDGKVVIEICEPRHVARIRVMDHDEFIEMDNWQPLEPATLNKDIRAYGLDGKPADSKEVLKALSKKRSVVYFLDSAKAKSLRPDPFYLSLLEKGSIVLVREVPAQSLEPVP